MIKRIIEVSSASYLSMKNRQLLIQRAKQPTQSLPIEDIGVLILDNTAISYTQAMLNHCLANNTLVILCNQQHLPHAILYPLNQNSLHSKIIHNQFQASQPLQKKIWREIIQAKIAEQSKNLILCKGKDFGLKSMQNRVLSGDSNNLEAQAARIYWKKLLGKEFHRDPTASGINTLLNYGYAIIRAVVSRAISATGLHSALGIHHHNQYNPFCLADDLMEPLRALVDNRVFQICSKEIPEEITPTIKKKILEILNCYCTLENNSYFLLTGVQLYVASFKKKLCKESKNFTIPSFLKL